jgi:hypothetical protein
MSVVIQKEQQFGRLKLNQQQSKILLQNQTKIGFINGELMVDGQLYSG